MSATDTTATPDVLISQLLTEEQGLRDIVEEFVSGLSRRVIELKAAYERLDWELLRTLAHRLKGTGGSYGYPVLSQLGKKMEDEFKAHRADDFVEHIRQLERLAAAAVAGLRKE